MAVNFPEHITLAEAWKILETRFAKDADKFKTKMEITAALDHVLAEDILAGRNVPHYAASAVDGYALRSADTAGASAATPAKVGAGKWQWMNTARPCLNGPTACSWWRIRPWKARRSPFSSR